VSLAWQLLDVPADHRPRQLRVAWVQLARAIPGNTTAEAQALIDAAQGLIAEL
jgi:hypothetical protein